MKIDIFNHLFPQRFWNDFIDVGTDLSGMGKRVQNISTIADLDNRFRVMDEFDDYCQIISLPGPPVEILAGPDKSPDMAKIANDGFAELCEKEKDYFPGWIAQASLAIPEKTIQEAERAMKNGALGVQIYTNVNDAPIDGPEYQQFWARMNELKCPIWVHPSRGARRSPAAAISAK